jgi:hypothetical protein
VGCSRRRGARSSPAYVHWEYLATILVHSTSLGCTLPIYLIAVGTALVAGPAGSLALFVAYSLGRGLVLTAVARVIMHIGDGCKESPCEEDRRSARSLRNGNEARDHTRDREPSRQ